MDIYLFSSNPTTCFPCGRSYLSWKSNLAIPYLKWMVCGFGSRAQSKAGAVTAKCAQDTWPRRTCSPVSCGIRVILNTTWKIAAESRGNLIYTWQMDGAPCTNADRSHSSRMWQMFVFIVSHVAHQIFHFHVSTKCN